MNPTRSRHWENLGVVVKDKQDWPDAICAYRKAIRLDWQNAHALVGLGNALLEQNQFREGRDAIVQGRRIGADDRELLQRTEGLLKVANRLVEQEAQLSDIIAGTRKPVSAEEARQFAHICRTTNRPLAAAKLFVVAFAVRPMDPVSLHDYQAIRMAALAGCGQCQDASTDEKERGQWRDQALTCLKANLDYWKSASPERRQQSQLAKCSLPIWRVDSSLARLRDPFHLAKLPESERNQWLQFWAEVDAALINHWVENSEKK